LYSKGTTALDSDLHHALPPLRKVSGFHPTQSQTWQARRSSWNTKVENM